MFAPADAAPALLREPRALESRNILNLGEQSQILRTAPQDEFSARLVFQATTPFIRQDCAGEREPLSVEGLQS